MIIVIFILFICLHMAQEIKIEKIANLVDGVTCKVIAGTHKGKSGTVRDVNTSKTGHITITIVQDNGVRFKTLGRSVESL